MSKYQVIICTISIIKAFYLMAFMAAKVVLTPLVSFAARKHLKLT